MYKFGAILVGVFVAFMVLFNGTLAANYGNYAALIIIHVVGLVGISTYLLIRKERNKINKSIPFYLFLGGAIGVILVSFNNICFSAIGVSLTIAFGLFGQIVMSLIVDHFGLFGLKRTPFNFKKIFGLLLIFSGVYVMTLG
jgi:transporter family-2 protein